MTSPFEDLATLDRLVHDPTRLAILTALMACENADFLFLQSVTGLTRGNLSAHLAKLEAADLVDITKRFIGKKPNTSIALAKAGRQAITDHWQKLDELRRASVSWRPVDAEAFEPG